MTTNISDLIEKIKLLTAEVEKSTELSSHKTSDSTDYDNETSELCDGCYVRDKQEGPKGEVYIMVGDPEDVRVWIADRHGRGWYISPSRLVRVKNSDPAIEKYFGELENNDEYDDDKKFVNEGKDTTFKALVARAELTRPDLFAEFGSEYVSQVASKIAEKHANDNTSLETLMKELVDELMKPLKESKKESEKIIQSTRNDAEEVGKKLPFDKNLEPGDVVVVKYLNKKTGRSGTVECIIYNRKTVADVIDDFLRDHGDHYHITVHEEVLNEYGDGGNPTSGVPVGQTQPLPQSNTTAITPTTHIPGQTQAASPQQSATTQTNATQSTVTPANINAALNSIKI